jgi:hypothetical protein
MKERAVYSSIGLTRQEFDLIYEEVVSMFLVADKSAGRPRSLTNLQKRRSE